MKTLVLAALLCFVPGAWAQNIEGQIIAAQYGQWVVPGMQPDSYSFTPTSCRVSGGASFFYAFSAGTPIKIVDGNPALTEIVTPSNVVENNSTCILSINPVNHHNLPFYLTSATGGLQEAINSNATNPATNTIILSNLWYQLGGDSSVIDAAKGVSELGLIDVTTLPSTWYRWNGTQYVVVPVGGRVDQIIAGQNVTINPTSGIGDVTINSTDNVTSVFGRTGAVTAETGDYTCLQVTGCGPTTGFASSLTAQQNPGDTTASINVSAGVLPPAGYFYIDSEWEYFSGFTSTGTGDFTLNNLMRGQFTTTAETHSLGATLNQATAILSPANGPAFAWIGGTAGNGQFLAIDCPLAGSFNDEVIAQFGCAGSGTGFAITNSGTIFSTATGANQVDNLSISPIPAAGNPNDSLDLAYIFTHTANVLRSDLPGVVSAGFGFPNGISGQVASVTPTNATAPLLVNQFVPAGSNTNSYKCVGIDKLGLMIDGNVSSISGLASTDWGSGSVGVQCYPIPGAVTTLIYRTAGVPNTGQIASTSNPGGVTDTLITATGTVPSGTTSIPLLCAGAYCESSGASPTPNFTCPSKNGVSTQGWIYHNLGASVSPFAQVCNGTSFVTAY
jgi:hypothetical protein